MNLLLYSLIIGTAFFPFPGTKWYLQQAVGLGILSILISHSLSKKFHLFVGTSFLIVMAYGIYLCTFPGQVFGNLGPVGVASWESSIAGALLTLILFAGASLKLKHEDFRDIIGILYLIAVLETIVILIRVALYGRSHAYYIMMHPSLEATFISVVFPMSFAQTGPKILKYLIIPAMISAVFLCHSSTGVMGLGVSSAAYLFSKYREKSIPVIVGFFLISAIAGHLVLGDKLLQDDGRYGIWETHMKFWSKEANHKIGTGPGTFYQYGPGVQILEECKNQSPTIHDIKEILERCSMKGNDAFTWMHNDWLQITYEGGYLLLASMSLMFLMMLWHSFGHPVRFAMTLSYGAIAFTQFPLRVFMLQILGFAILGGVLSSRQVSSQSLELEKEFLKSSQESSSRSERLRAWRLRQ